MRLCRQCSAAVELTDLACYRCGRRLPGVSRRRFRRAAVRGGAVVAIIGVVLAVALLIG